MQFKLLFVVVLLGAQLSQISAYPTENKSLIDDLIEKAKELYEAVKDLIGVKLQEAIDNLEKIRNKIMQDSLDIVQAVKREIQIIINNAKQNIEAIKQQADELGIDISHCLEDIDERFDALFMELMQKEGQCVQTEIDSAMEIIDEAVVFFFEAIQTIFNMPNRIKQCRTVDCLKEVIDDLVTIENELPEQINKTEEQVQEFVEGFKERIEICSMREVGDAAIKVAEIINDVAVCAASKKKGLTCPL